MGQGMSTKQCLHNRGNYRGKVQGYINIINLAEIYYVLFRLDSSLVDIALTNLNLHGLKVVPIEHNDTLWRHAAKLKANHSLSLADAFAAATAVTQKSKLVVGNDQEFEGIEVGLLRIRG